MAEVDIDIHWLSGQCPVESEGTINGIPYYFRARGERWSLGVGGDVVLKPSWYYEEAYGTQRFAAGWMTEREANMFLRQAAQQYHEERAQ